MLSKFKNNLEQINGVNPDTDRFLLAVSGGLDSIVMTRLFQKANYFMGIAHCNFQLRESAAQEDEAFVKTLAEKIQKPFFHIRFETEEYAKTEKQSIQLAARTLRYDWLGRVRQENGYDWVVTAHHLDDNLETFLYNFTKGTGIRGLQGIPEKNQRVIRPLLKFSREELETYYYQEELKHREDTSNQTNKYSRNQIRHQVIPILRNINPGLLSSFQNSLYHLADTYHIFQEKIENWRSKSLTERPDGIVQIEADSWLKHKSAGTILFELLRFANFNSRQVDQILVSLQTKRVGTHFFSETHELLVDRATLLLKKRTNKTSLSIEISSIDQLVDLPGASLSIQRIQGQPSTFDPNKNIAYFDAKALVFPLKMRHWKAGDRFCPLGMGGKHKKIQDLFSDLKLDRFAKEKVWILENGDGSICWVLGVQTDDRFKIKSDTQAYYKCQLTVHQ